MAIVFYGCNPPRHPPVVPTSYFSVIHETSINVTRHNPSFIHRKSSFISLKMNKCSSGIGRGRGRGALSQRGERGKRGRGDDDESGPAPMLSRPLQSLLHLRIQIVAHVPLQTHRISLPAARSLPWTRNGNAARRDLVTRTCFCSR